MKNLEIQLIKSEQGNIILVLYGTFDAAQALGYKELLFQYLNDTEHDCIVDLSAIQKMDLSALNILIQMHMYLIGSGRQLHIKTLHNKVSNNLFKLTKMDRMLNLH